MSKKNKNRLVLAIVALACGLWTILPDPVPIVLDDIGTSLASAASIIALIVSFLKKGQ